LHDKGKLRLPFLPDNVKMRAAISGADAAFRDIIGAPSQYNNTRMLWSADSPFTGRALSN
jgi:hypothetical protein